MNWSQTDSQGTSPEPGEVPAGTTEPAAEAAAAPPTPESTPEIDATAAPVAPPVTEPTVAGSPAEAEPPAEAPPPAPAVADKAPAEEVRDGPVTFDFSPMSSRPIDKFIAMSLNDINRLIGTSIPAGRRGQTVEIVAVSETGVARKTSKGTNTEIPRPALEWAIKQLYLNGELTRSKMTESYKENGSTVASSVFQVLGNVKFFEATETPLTLHFYKLQWEDELYG